MIDDYYEDEREDDAEQKGLEWKIDPVSKETDNERLIDDNIVDVAMEFIRGKTKNKNHVKQHDLLSKIKDSASNEDLLLNPKQKLNKDLKEIREFESWGLPDIEDNSSSSENTSEDYIDTNKHEDLEHKATNNIAELNTEKNTIPDKDTKQGSPSNTITPSEDNKAHKSQELINEPACDLNEESKEDLHNDSEEVKEYYDTEYWRDPYTTGFKIDDLLREFH
jgi:hypothetical protein